MKFCILVVHDLTNDVSYNAKLNRSKNCYFGNKIVKILWKNRKKWENICIIHICWDIGIKSCTGAVHILNKNISYDSKLNESKNLSFWGKYSNSVLNCLSFIIIPLDSKIQIKVLINDLTLLLDLFGNSERTKLLIWTVISCLVFTAPEKWRMELWAKTGHYRNRCFIFKRRGIYISLYLLPNPLIYCLYFAKCKLLKEYCLNIKRDFY